MIQTYRVYTEENSYSSHETKEKAIICYNDMLQLRQRLRHSSNGILVLIRHVSKLVYAINFDKLAIEDNELEPGYRHKRYCIHVKYHRERYRMYDYDEAVELAHGLFKRYYSPYGIECGVKVLLEGFYREDVA